MAGSHSSNRREVSHGVLGAPPQARAETVDDFVDDYAHIVVDSGLRAVARGEGTLRPELAAASDGDIERTLAEKIRRSLWKGGDDDARSLAESVAASVQALLKPRRHGDTARIKTGVRNGRVDLPGHVLAERAREKAAREPSVVEKVWVEVRYNQNSPVKIIMDNKMAAGLAGGGLAPTFQNGKGGTA
ncbi:hypothetical protein DFJ74DRAFT_697078 [Hyaloraphidium curvatum]|nr:hypothetical protein DFJ74DRAFT_697078 [Hyaloraphidium curvatum]